MQIFLPFVTCVLVATAISAPDIPESHYVEIEYAPVVCEDCGERISTTYFEDGSYQSEWENGDSTTGCLPYQLCDQRVVSSTFDEEMNSIVAVLDSKDTVIVTSPLANQVWVTVIRGDRLSETYCVPYVGDC